MSGSVSWDLSSSDAEAKRALAAIALTGLLLLTLGAVSGVAAADGRPVAVFLSDDGTVTVLHSDGSTDSLDQSASVLGPMRDYDSDGVSEVALVDSNGRLSIVDTEGERQLLATGADPGKTTIASGDWDGDGTPAVLYANESDNDSLYRVEAGERPQRVLATQTKGVVGVADFDQDGDRDVVFLGSSSEIRYYDGTSVETTGYSSIGSNNGRGVGSLADFDGDGQPRVPVVDGSNNLALVCPCGEKTTLDSNYQQASKSPVAAVDWTGDDRLEILHVDTDGELAYATLGGESGLVERANGDSIGATGGVGVAPVVDTSPPVITDYDASNPDNRTVRVSFESDEALSEIAVAIDGDGSTTLGTDQFDEAGSGPYTYTATDEVERDGTYEITLETARSAGGDGASGQTTTVTVDTPAPEFSGSRLSDLTDGDGAVADGDTVRVSASVSGVENGSVTANFSAFGAGEVTLTEGSNSTYSATARVDASSVPDGRVRTLIRAQNQYGKQATTETTDLALDTTPPTARAGSDRTVTVGESVSVDGGASTDSVGIDRYRWTFDDGSMATGKTAVHEYDSPGTYEITLTVTDVAGHTDETRLTVDVVERAGTTTSERTETPTATPPPTRTVAPTPGQTATRPSPDPTTRTDTETVPAPTTDPELDSRTPTATGTTEDGSGDRTERVVEHFEGLTGTERGALLSVAARTSASSMDLSTESTRTPPDSVPALGDRSGIDVVRYVSVSHETPNDAIAGASLTVEVDREALGQAPPDDLSLYRYADGTWTRLGTLALDTTGQIYRYRAESPGLSTFAIGTTDASVSMTRTTLHDRTVRVGESVEVTARLHNSGTVEGTRVLSLSVDGTRTERLTVSVPAGTSRNVTFDTTFASRGTYEVAVDDTRVGTVEVTGQPPIRQNPLGIPRLPVCGYACDVPLVGLVGALLGGALVVRRRHRRLGHRQVIEALRYYE